LKNLPIQHFWIEGFDRKSFKGKILNPIRVENPFPQL
jgi:hypothetical protein